MGSTGYVGLNAAEAKARELWGLDILASSGSWHVCRNPHGWVFMAHTIVRRYKDETVVKTVTSDMGPGATPPQRLFRLWLRERGDQPFGTYEADWVESCEAEYARRSRTLKAGDTFTVASPWSFRDGVTEDTFVLVARYRARRKSDGRLVQLPKRFRAQVASVSRGS